MINSRNWEYRDLSYCAWNPSDTWTCLAGNLRYSILLAQDFFWQTHQDRIMSQVSDWTTQGWEPVEEISPALIKVSHIERTESRIDETDVLSWILTFGIGLIIQLVLGTKRKYSEYSPIEFRVTMRRPEQTSRLVAAETSFSTKVN